MASLVANVYAEGAWYGPSYPAAGDPPRGSVTNPAAWDEFPDDTDGDYKDAEGAPTPPPRSGRGSSDAAWTAYAQAHSVSVTEAMTRTEVIAACEAAGVPTD